MIRCSYWLKALPARLVRLAVPAMVPGAEAFAGAAAQERPVWQLGFYAPLEQTKGLKLFCDAVELLPPTVLHRPGFEVCSAPLKRAQMQPSVWERDVMGVGALHHGLPRCAWVAFLRLLMAHQVHLRHQPWRLGV